MLGDGDEGCWEAGMGDAGRWGWGLLGDGDGERCEIGCGLGTQNSKLFSHFIHRKGSGALLCQGVGFSGI